MGLVAKLSRLLVLGGLGYVGFYVYGVVMGVFSPVQFFGFTVLAFVFVGLFVLHVIRVRQAMQAPEQRKRMMHEAHVYRERRGF